MGHPNSSQMIYDLQQEIKELAQKGYLIRLEWILWKALQIL